MTGGGDPAPGEATRTGSWASRSPWDAVVVGGGPAGSVVALALAEAGRRVLLAERRNRVDFKFGELLSPLAQPLLCRAGLDMTQLGREHAPARGTVSVWGGSDPYVRDFIFNPYGDGVRLDRPRFDRELRAQAERSGAVVATGVRLVAVAGGDPWRLRLEDADGTREQSARYLVDCSGRRSVVARRLGLPRDDADRLIGFGVRYTSAGAEIDPFLRIEAQPGGWIYTLQLPSGDRMVVFHTDADLPVARMAADPDGFGALVAASGHVGALLRDHGYAPATRPRAAAAGGARVGDAVGARRLAAGDAALAFDPLSSQGIGSALETGFGAADAVLADDAGRPAELDRYAAHLDAVHAEYQANHRYYYGVERRWEDEPFWARRHALPSPP